MKLATSVLRVCRDGAPGRRRDHERTDWREYRDAGHCGLYGLHLRSLWLW